MGAELSIAPQPVRTHVPTALEKLGAANRVQAVATALRESLIS
jgi:DNA-binding NarL/FixJ family response regulator